jgi:hypothetical protein
MTVEAMRLAEVYSLSVDESVELPTWRTAPVRRHQTTRGLATDLNNDVVLGLDGDFPDYCQCIEKMRRCEYACVL